MKITVFMERSDYKFLGGDRLCDNLIKGLREMGHEGVVSSSVDDVLTADLVILIRYFDNDDMYYRMVKLLGKPYVYIPFFDDFTKFDRVMRSFYYYIVQLMLGYSKELSWDLLWEVPELLHYNDIVPNNAHIVHRNVYKDALFCFTNSRTEKEALQKTFRHAKVETIFLPPGQVTEVEPEYSDKFLSLLKDLKKGSYLLQIGRFELRKNQLATILASKDIDVPLVLISTDILTNHREYSEVCIEAIKKWRKGPTYIFSRFLNSYDDGKLRIIQLDAHSLFDDEMIRSAFQNAGLYIHPAYSELPGYVYLEAAKLGIPILASEWTTIKDYFTDDTGRYLLDDRILYVTPHHLHELEKGIENHFGKCYDPCSLPILQKTNRQFAGEFCSAVNKYLPSFHLPK